MNLANDDDDDDYDDDDDDDDDSKSYQVSLRTRRNDLPASPNSCRSALDLAKKRGST